MRQDDISADLILRIRWGDILHYRIGTATGKPTDVKLIIVSRGFITRVTGAIRAPFWDDFGDKDKQNHLDRIQRDYQSMGLSPEDGGYVYTLPLRLIVKKRYVAWENSIAKHLHQILDIYRSRNMLSGYNPNIQQELEICDVHNLSKHYFADTSVSHCCKCEKNLFKPEPTDGLAHIIGAN